jgi:hypothetical protein
LSHGCCRCPRFGLVVAAFAVVVVAVPFCWLLYSGTYLYGRRKGIVGSLYIPVVLLYIRSTSIYTLVQKDYFRTKYTGTTYKQNFVPEYSSIQSYYR